MPATNRNYWLEKLDRNRARDERNIKLLEENGWAVRQCQLKDMTSTAECLVAFLDS